MIADKTCETISNGERWSIYIKIYVQLERAKTGKDHAHQTMPAISSANLHTFVSSIHHNDNMLKDDPRTMAVIPVV